MSAGRRIAKLEGTLHPQAAVLHWLAEAHESGSLVAYVGSLLDEPMAQAPFVMIPERARAAVRVAHRGKPRPAVREAERRATEDAVFLLELVLELERAAQETLRIGALHLAALRWEMRARLAEEDLDQEEADVGARRKEAEGWAAWRAAVIALASTVYRAEEARRLLEAHYLDGRSAIFPDAQAAWDDLREG